MSCIDKIERYFIPNEIVVSLSKIYTFIGKNDHYTSSVKNDLAKIIEDTIQRDTYFLSKMIKLDLSDNRTRLIISKDSSPRTNDETVLYNLKHVIENIQFFASDIDFNAKKILSYINQIYCVKSTNYKSAEEEAKVEEWAKKVAEMTKLESIDRIYLNLHYVIDLYNFEPLTDHNEMLTYLALYIMLLNAHIDCFKFLSLFEALYPKKEELLDQLNNTKFNWAIGHAQTNEFVSYIASIIIDTYKEVDKFIKNYTDDVTSNKTDAILNTILNLPRTFTKEDIRAYHPYVSESTINRVLTKLREENQIKPTGNGRSAKWIKTGMF